MLITGTLTIAGCGFKYISIVYEVIDEQGRPIPGAKVNSHYFTGGGRNTKDYFKNGEADSNGIYTYRDIAKGIAEISVDIKKDGYYSSWDSVGPTELYGKKKKHKVVTLIKKNNPIKMYAKHLNLEFPIKNGQIGYDLVVGDFVTPYGSGQTEDFIFHVSPESKVNHLQNLTFSNPGDGVQPFFVATKSSLKAGRNAPESGYLSSWKEADDLGYKLHAQKGYQADSRMRGTTTYYFRVRTQNDGTAMYGYFSMKYWGIYPTIFIDYYLSPAGTTNIEYGGSFFHEPVEKDKSYYLPKVPD